MSNRPEFCTDAHLKYLDALRESGATNMFGAGSYLQNAFRELISEEEKADTILLYWMDTFGDESR